MFYKALVNSPDVVVNRHLRRVEIIRTAAAMEASSPLIVWNGIYAPVSVLMQLPVARGSAKNPETPCASARLKARQLRRHLKRVLGDRGACEDRETGNQSLQAVHYGAKYRYR